MTVKKVTAILIFLMALIAAIALIWHIIIIPFIELGSKYGFAGIAAWVLALVIVSLLIRGILKVVSWAMDNI
jgi:hypothetical protein